MAAKKDSTKNRAPQRVAGSVADQINNLAVNQSIATAERFEIEAVDAGGLLESLKKQRSGLAAYVARITEELDSREFKVEGGCYVTDDKSAIIATVTVTRIA